MFRNYTCTFQSLPFPNTFHSGLSSGHFLLPGILTLSGQLFLKILWFLQPIHPPDVLTVMLTISSCVLVLPVVLSGHKGTLPNMLQLIRHCSFATKRPVFRIKLKTPYSLHLFWKSLICCLVWPFYGYCKDITEIQYYLCMIKWLANSALKFRIRSCKNVVVKVSPRVCISSTWMSYQTVCDPFGIA